MSFYKKWFKRKKYNCIYCRDCGGYKEAIAVARIIEYFDGVQAISFASPTDNLFEFRPCPNRCDTWKENSEKYHSSGLLDG